MRETPPSSPQPDIAQAVRDVRAGKRNAFAAIVRQYQESVMTVLCVMLRDRTIAQEASADVFVRAFEHLHSFDASRPMKPWLIGIAHRVAKDYLRKKSRDFSQRQRLAVEVSQIKEELNPLEMAVRSERDRILWRNVSRLAESERLAVVLFYREDLNVEETARIMGLAPGTVKSLLFRGREHLREMLAEPDPQTEAI